MKIPTTVSTRTQPTERGLAPLDGSATAASFGSTTAQGIVNLGEGAQKLGNAFLVEEKAQREKVEDFETARRLTEQNTEFALEVDGIKKAAPPSGVGVREQIEGAFNKRFNEFLGTVPERSKAEYGYKLEGMRGQRVVDASQFETVAGRAFYKTGIDDETSRAKIAINQTPDLYDAERARVFETVDKSGLSVIEKEEIKRNVERGLQQVHYKRSSANGTFTPANTPVEGAVSVFVDRIIGAESGGNPNAKNPKSSAAGLGQFIDSTWIEQLRKTRPDLTQGQPDENLLALKLDPKLQREVLTNFTIENAKSLRKDGIVPSPSNIYLAHFLGAAGAKRVLTARENQPIETVVDSASMKANKEVFSKASTVAELKAWAQGKMGDAQIPAGAAAVKDEQGYWRVPGVEYDLQGKIRAIPPTKEYIERVMPALKNIAPDLGIKITSGGQDPFTGKAYGSHRHDVNEKGEANTTDFVLTRGGKPVTPKEDPKLYERAAEELAAQGFTGIGHYSWGMHVGGGSRAVWGPDKTAATAAPAITAAVQRGWARAADGNKDALDTDPRYGALTYEDRVSLRADGQREAAAQSNAQLQQEQIAMTQQRNKLYTDLFDGKAGQADIDNARMQGILPDYEGIKKATEILNRKAEGISLEQAAMQKLGTNGAVWSPTDSEDKKMLNALIGEKGQQALGQKDKAYLTDFVIPVVERSRDIPTDVVGTLTGMIRSRDQSQVEYALDSLTQLQDNSPRAYSDRISEETKNDVSRYRALKDTVPMDELIRTINGGNSQEERVASEMRRKDGEKLLATKSGKVPKIDALVKEIVGDYDGWFSSAPQLGKSAAMSTAIERFSEELWLTEYIKTGKEDAATKVVKERVKERFGVSELGGNGKILMELPPQNAGYRSLGGSFDWIDKDVREGLKLKPEEKYELITTEQTRLEHKAWKEGRGPLPSYDIIKLDANGVPHAGVFDEKGRPKRVRFTPKPTDIQADLDYATREEAIAKNDLFFAEIGRTGAMDPVPSLPTGEKETPFSSAFKEQIPVPKELRAEYARRVQERFELQKPFLTKEEKEKSKKYLDQLQSTHSSPL
jgi:hypothetical protein